MEKLPQSWHPVPLYEIVKMNPGVDKSKFRDEDNVPFVPMPAVEARTGRIDTRERRPFGKVKSGFTPFASGDVLFAKITPCMENGKMAVVPPLPNDVGFGTTEFHVLRPTEVVVGKLLYYFVSSASVRHEAQHQMTGAVGQKRVPKRYLETKTFPLPPLNEQHRIVEKIETLFARLDKGEETLREVQKLLARYRQSVLKAAVTGQLTADWRAENAHRLEHGRDLLARILQTRRETWEGRGKYKEPAAPDTTGLPELPEGWVWATLPMLGEFGRGKSKHRPRNDPKLYEGGKYPFLQTGRVRSSGGRITQHDGFYNEFGLSQSKIWPKGTICITIAANIAESGILEIDACFPDSVVGLVPHPEVSEEYVECFIRTAKENLDRYAPATAQKNINLEILNAVAVPLPPSAEQTEIRNMIDQAFSTIHSAEQVCQSELIRSTALRQSILKDAFAGRLVPQDPNDEPASELLGRIRAERGEGPTTRARRRVNP